MGMDFECGCRKSMGGWYLCERHEVWLYYLLEEESKKRANDEYELADEQRECAKLEKVG